MLALLAMMISPALFDVPTMHGAHVGIYAVSADTGAEIYAHNPDDEMVPASNFKLIVGSASLDLLGPAFSFTTTLAADGSTLYLRGDGDPYLNAADLTAAAGAASAEKGTPFTSLVGDTSAVIATRYPPGWETDDLPYDYAAPPSALGFDGNQVHVHVVPGALGAPAMISVTPQGSPLTIHNATVTGAAHSDDTLRATMAWDSPDTLTVYGSIPLDRAADDFPLSVLDSRQYALSMLAQSLATAGIDVGHATEFAPTPADARVIWTHHSVPLTQLVGDMWLPSDNLLAESLLDAIGAASPATPGDDTRSRALDRERAWLTSIGVNPATVSLSDGSGLSTYDRITPRDLVTILLHDWNGPNRATVLAGLPTAGKDGTLKHAFLGTPLVGDVIAKTGTVSHTRTLSGFLRTSHGMIVFSLLIDDWVDDSPQAGANLRAFQASILEALAKG